MWPKGIVSKVSVMGSDSVQFSSTSFCHWTQPKVTCLKLVRRRHVYILTVICWLFWGRRNQLKPQQWHIMTSMKQLPLYADPQTDIHVHLRLCLWPAGECKWIYSDCSSGFGLKQLLMLHCTQLFSNLVCVPFRAEQIAHRVLGAFVLKKAACCEAKPWSRCKHHNNSLRDAQTLWSREELNSSSYNSL